MLAAVRSGALHAACVAARVIHHSGIPRCGCSNSSDVRIKSAASPVSNYAPMIRSCNGLLQHFFDCCVPATRQASRCDAIGCGALLRGGHGSKKAAAALPSSTTIEPVRRAIAAARQGAACPDRYNPRGISPRTFARRGCRTRPGSRPALQDSVEMLRFRAPEQPPVREAAIR